MRTLPKAGSILRGITQEPCACRAHCAWARATQQSPAPTAGTHSRAPAPITPRRPVPAAHSHPKASSSSGARPGMRTRVQARGGAAPVGGGSTGVTKWQGLVGMGLPRAG